MRIGIMGGTFDPIHNGHLNAAEEIADFFRLERVIFVPAFSPPHKKRKISSARHRLNMALLGVLTNPRFEVSDLEIERGGISYTFDTIIEIKKRFKEKTELFFISGLDAFKEIGEWHKAGQIFNESNFVVASRPGSSADDLRSMLEKTVTERFGDPQFIFSAKKYKDECTCIKISGSPFTINVISSTALDISSTLIRDRVKKGRSVQYLVPQPVECYIRKERLYVNSSIGNR